MQRVLIVLSVSAIMLSLIAPIAIQAAPALARQDTAGGGNETVSYTSPAFGFTVSWSEADWALEELDHWWNGWNELGLAHTGVEDAELSVVGDADFDGDPQACLQDVDDFLRTHDDITELQVTDTPAGLPQTGIIDEAMARYTYTWDVGFGPTRYARLVACETLVPGEAVLMLELRVPESSYEAMVEPFEALVADIALGGEADRAGALQGLYEQAYTNPRWGFTVPLNEAGWTLQVIDHSLNYLQGIELERESSYAFIEAEGYNYETEEGLSPERCLRDALEDVRDFDGVADIAVTSDPAGFAPGMPGKTASALVTYTMPEDGGDRIGYTDYIGCQSMDGGLAVLSVWISSDSDAYASEEPAIQQLVHNITVPTE